MAKNKNKKKIPFNVFRKGITAGALGLAMLLGGAGMLTACGEKGDRGDTGASGKSAYELAVEQGFQGTLTEWLESLKGQSGGSGSAGNDGRGIASIEKTGTNGLVDTYTITFTDGSTTTFTITNGENGTTPNAPEVTINAQGYWVINGTPTSTLATAEDGKTPYIEGEYWYIDGVSTGVKAQGAQGNDGKSAFDLYKEQNPTYTGTLADWLETLKGQDGTVWFTGTLVTGLGSSIVREVTGSKVGDLYLNTTTNDVYECTATSTWKWITNIKGAKGDDGEPGEDGNDGVDVGTLQGSTYMHISFDDVEKCFANLKNNTYTSLWNEPMFGWLKGLHDTYGAVFSLYAYGNALSGVPSTYAAEFYAAKDWLKIGLHATSSSSYFSSSTYEQAKTTWNTFVDNVVNITGSYLSVDRMPRLHTFAGNEEALKGMRDANYGALGFLSADDSRTSYYFDSDTTTYLYSNNHIIDHKNGLVFVATDMRADWFNSSFSSSNTYREPTEDNVYDELVLRYTSVDYANSIKSYIFFGHEWDFYNGSTFTTSVSSRYEDACKFAKDYNIAFDFSENRAFNNTPYDIYPAGTGDTTTDDTEQVDPSNYAIFGTDEKSLLIVDDISDLDFVAGKSVGSKANGFSDAVGRATSITQVLAVNGGQVVTLNQGIDGVTLTYSLTESTSKLINSTTIPTGGYGAESWLAGNATLQETTKYILIAFKKGDGSTDFTSSELAQLKNCITITEASDEEDSEPTVVSTTFNGFELEIVEDFTEVQYVTGKSIGGASLNFTDTVGRAVSQTQLFKVNASKRILSLDQTKTSVSLNYTIYQFSDIPLDSTTFVNKSDAGTWTDGEYTLNGTTQYIMIVFKNATDGSTDFSSEDLALLNTCVTFSEPDEGTVLYYDTTMIVVDSISEMTFDGNYAPPGYAAADFTPVSSSIKGRATCVTTVLAVNGGETIGFVDNLEEVFGSTALSFAVLEFASTPLSNETLSFTGATSQTATAEQKAACAGAWLTADHTLQSNTRYVIIAFKNGEGTTNFTTEQLVKLSQCLEVKTNA